MDKLKDIQIKNTPKKAPFNLSVFIFLFSVLSIGTGISYGKNISTGTININTASAYELSLLPGIGQSTAKRIIASRTEKPFRDIKDLKDRRLIRSNYFTNAQKLISFRGAHRYDDPNKKPPQAHQKKSKKASYWKPKYSIDKGIDIEDAKQITLLTDGRFFNRLKKVMQHAKSEIWLSTFVFKTTKNKGNRANQIVQTLINKAKQGISVKLLLEQSDYHQELSAGNHRLSKRLRQNNIQVFFDSMDNTMHSKVAVIDREYVFLGSHNMTDSALRHNHEVSLMIESSILAKELIEYFETIAKEQ